MKWAVPSSDGANGIRSPRSAVAADVPDCAAAGDAAAVVDADDATAAGSQMPTPAPCDGCAAAQWCALRQCRPGLTWPFCKPLLSWPRTRPEARPLVASRAASGGPGGGACFTSPASGVERPAEPDGAAHPQVCPCPYQVCYLGPAVVPRRVRTCFELDASSTASL
jgi:hypothetical protein